MIARLVGSVKAPFAVSGVEWIVAETLASNFLLEVCFVLGAIFKPQHNNSKVGRATIHGHSDSGSGIEVQNYPIIPYGIQICSISDLRQGMIWRDVLEMHQSEQFR